MDSDAAPHKHVFKSPCLLVLAARSKTELKRLHPLNSTSLQQYPHCFGQSIYSMFTNDKLHRREQACPELPKVSFALGTCSFVCFLLFPASCVSVGHLVTPSMRLQLSCLSYNVGAMFLSFGMLHWRDEKESSNSLSLFLRALTFGVQQQNKKKWR